MTAEQDNTPQHATANGRTVDEDQIQAWADEAEAGYDVDELLARRRDRHDADERFVERGEPTAKS